MAARSSATGAANQAAITSPNGVLAARIRINELFVRFLSSDDGAEIVDVMVAEHLAAARHRQAPPPMSEVDVDNAPDAGTSATASPASHYDPHTPVTPPHNPRPVRPLPEGSSPHRYIDRVDELDMRSSVGAASPVSPNQAVRTVDPSLPRSPDPHRRMAAAGGASAVPFGDSPQSPGAHPGATGAGGAQGLQQSHSQPSSRAASPIAGHSSQPTPRIATYDDVPRFHLVKKGRVLSGKVDGSTEEIEALNRIYAAGAGSSKHKLMVVGARGRDVQVDIAKGIRRRDFEPVCMEVFRLPGWLRNALFARLLEAVGAPDNGPNTSVRYQDVKRFYDSHMAPLTPNRRLFELIRSPESRQDHLTVEELARAVRQLVNVHTCLEFLTQPEFQELYCKTVATRIVYHHERRQSRTVAWIDFDKSDVPGMMRSLDNVTDINQVLRYFSYEHFYVLYCRFWELDQDKRHSLTLNALSQYGQGSLTPLVLERVVQGKGHRLVNPAKQELEFEDFVYFCLSEEDKNSLPAKRYWFNILDVDEDGVLSGAEMAHFFAQQTSRFEEFAAEDLKFEDMLCQMLDMFIPKLPNKQGITYADLRDCATAEHFFNMLFNANKFWSFEHRDPFAESQQRNAFEQNAWDRFARAEYDRMAQEAGQ